ncbi:hypothetical protein [Streptacidiphilus sp. PAMC 29251]
MNQGSARTASSTTCPLCGAPCITTPTGRLLEPHPHPLAIHLPDGQRLNAVTAAAISTGRAPPRAHHPHAPGPYGCTPPPPLTLF